MSLASSGPPCHACEPKSRALLSIVLFTVGYFVAAELGHLLSFPGDFASLWPPSGVYLTALLLFGFRWWPLLLLGALVSNLASDVGFHGKTVLVSVGFWAANTVEAVTAAVILWKAVGMPFTITRMWNVSWLLIAVIFGTAVGAFIGSAVVVSAFGGSYGSVWCLWWMSGALGALLVVPAIVNFVNCKPWQNPGQHFSPGEALVVMLVTAGTAEFVFGRQSNPLPFITLPIVVWASIRLRVCGAVMTTSVLAVITVWNTASGNGPFAGSRPTHDQVLLMQGFLGTAVGLALILATLTMERTEAAEAMQHARRELEEANDQLRRLAATDALTGVNNRGAFQKKLNEEIERAHRYDTSLSIVLLDVDRFKLFNDTHGHPAGDDVLRTVARLIQQTARSTDFVARYGGEEFIVILPHTDESAAVRVAERFRQTIAMADWPLRSITISVGVSTLTADVTATSLIEQADQALYQSKKTGRDRVNHSSGVVSLMTTRRT